MCSQRRPRIYDPVSAQQNLPRQFPAVEWIAGRVFSATVLIQQYEQLKSTFDLYKRNDFAGRPADDFKHVLFECASYAMYVHWDRRGRRTCYVLCLAVDAFS